MVKALVPLVAAVVGWSSPARADVYGGFSIGGALLAIADAPGQAGLTLSGKLGGRGDQVGGYGRLRGSAAEVNGITVGWGEIAGGIDLFVGNGSSFYGQLGWSRITGDDGTTSVELGTGPSIGLGFDLLVARPFMLSFYYDHGFISSSAALDGYGVSNFVVNALGLEAVFEW